MDNDNRGAIWKNEKRQKDTQPHWTGNATIDGKEYWVSAWKGDSDKARAPVVSFAFNAKEAPQAPKAIEDFSGDIPF